MRARADHGRPRACISSGTAQGRTSGGARFLVTRHTGVSPSIDQLWVEAEADSLAILLARRVVNRYLPILLALETRLDDLEDEMMAQPTELAELVGHKAQLKKLRRVITLFLNWQPPANQSRRLAADRVEWPRLRPQPSRDTALRGAVS